MVREPYVLMWERNSFIVVNGKICGSPKQHDTFRGKHPKKSHVRELARKQPLRDSQQTKSESNRILAKGDCSWNSSLTGVVPLNSGPSRKTIAMDVVGYLENGRLQIWALTSAGKKQLNLGRLFKTPYSKAHLYWQGVRILKKERKSTYNIALLICLFVFTE